MKRRGEKITMVTAYDATFSRVFDEAGADVLLVGDSLGMVIQGHDSTLPVTLDEVVYHCRAVARRALHAHVVADMPFMTYQVNADDAVRNAGRLLAEGGAHAVKLEGGVAIAPIVERITRAGIPVMGHVGLTPQSVHAMGGFRVQGKSREAADQVLLDARAIETAGAYAIVLEGIPTDLAEQVTRELSIPTIGIGAGPSCDGQVLVSYDLLGLTADLRPRFVKRYEAFYERGLSAVRAYVDEVRSGVFPGPEHGFGCVQTDSATVEQLPRRTEERKIGYGPES
jgi:3-methyl-2-oxobutanoate hydroxymethyltransferase